MPSIQFHPADIFLASGVSTVGSSGASPWQGPCSLTRYYFGPIQGFSHRSRAGIQSWMDMVPPAGPAGQHVAGGPAVSVPDAFPWPARHLPAVVLWFDWPLVH